MTKLEKLLVVLRQKANGVRWAQEEFEKALDAYVEARSNKN